MRIFTITIISICLIGVLIILAPFDIWEGITRVQEWIKKWRWRRRQNFSPPYHKKEPPCIPPRTIPRSTLDDCPEETDRSEPTKRQREPLTITKIGELIRHKKGDYILIDGGNIVKILSVDFPTQMTIRYARWYDFIWWLVRRGWVKSLGVVGK